MPCNCCCGCQKAFTPEEIAYYSRINPITDTTLCFDCQAAYEEETNEKWASENA